MWRNGTPFGVKDPHFGKDVGFYVFDYPWLRFLTSFSFAMIVISVIAVVFISYVFGGIRLAGRGPRVHPRRPGAPVGAGRPRRAAAGRARTTSTGSGSRSARRRCSTASATPTPTPRIPARTSSSAWRSCAPLLFFAAIFIRSWVLPGHRPRPAAAHVDPDRRHLAVRHAVLPGQAVRAGQGGAVHRAQHRGHPRGVRRRRHEGRSRTRPRPTLTPAELHASAESRVSTRLLDPTLIAAGVRAAAAGARLLLRARRPSTSTATRSATTRSRRTSSSRPASSNLAGLQAVQRNWANDHTVYTHGYGIIAARGNQRGPQGEPVWVEQGHPADRRAQARPARRASTSARSRPSYSIVGRPKGADADRGRHPARRRRPASDDKANATQNTYDGKGGVPIGNLFNQALYAFKFAEPNIVLSSRVNSASKIIYDRHPRDRVKKVAPWLTVDGDTYPAVVDGKVVWIVDAYTTSNSYPYSEHRSLRDGHRRHADAGRVAGGAADRPGQLHAQLRQGRRRRLRRLGEALPVGHQGPGPQDVDEGLPRRRSSRRAEISEPLLEHLRYPVDMFKVQRDVLRATTSPTRRRSTRTASAGRCPRTRPAPEQLAAAAVLPVDEHARARSDSAGVLADERLPAEQPAEPRVVRVGQLRGDRHRGLRQDADPAAAERHAGARPEPDRQPVQLRPRRHAGAAAVPAVRRARSRTATC